MKKKMLIRSALVLTIGTCLLLPILRAADADLTNPIPAIVQAGLAVFASGGAEPAVLAWRKGGPLEGEKDATAQTENFRQMERSFGHYRSYELIETKDIAKSSKIIYLAMNFERGASFARFLVYRTRKDWIVQDMDFDTKPEAIMPWLAVHEAK